MIFQKFPILFIITIIAVFQPLMAGNSSDRVSLPKRINQIENRDSLIKEISISGWNKENLTSYSNYINNSKINPKTESAKIKSLPQGYQTSILQALILKKEYDFKSMYDSLESKLYLSPASLNYYEELVFASNATGLNAALENQVKESKSLAEVYKNYVNGLIKAKQSEYKSALSLFQKTEEKFPRDKELQYQISYIYRNLGDYQKALDILKKAVDNNLNDKIFLSKSYLAEGSLYFLSGDYTNAEEYYKKGMNESIKTGNTKEQAKAYINLAIIEDVKGNLYKARKYYSEAIKLADEIKDIETLATANSELGVSYTYTKELIKSKRHYLKSIDLYKKMNNKLRLSLLRNNLGKIYMFMFDYQTAIKYFEKGLESAGDNIRSRALNLMGLGDAYTNLANYTKALRYYRQAKNTSAEIKDISLKAQVNSGLGILNYNIDNYKAALGYFKLSDTLSSESQNPYLKADAYHKLGTTYLQLDSLEKAESFLKEAIELSRKISDVYTEALSNLDLASTYITQNKFKAAEGLIRKGESISNTYEFNYLLSEANLLLGSIYDKKDDFKKAEEYYKKSLALSKRLNESNSEIDAYYLLAKLFDKHNLDKAADSYYTSTVNLIEDVSEPLFKEEDVQISYFSGKRNVYDSYARFLMKNNRFQRAFEIIDRSRSRNTMQNLNNLKLSSLINDKNVLDLIYEYNWQIHSGLYEKAALDSIKQDYALLKEKLIKINPSVKKYINFKEYYTLPEIQKGLKSNETLISYYTTNNKIYVFIIDKNNFRHEVLNIKRKELIKLISSVSPYFDQSDALSKIYYNQDLFSFNAESANKFYNKIVKPVTKDIAKNSKIIISPSTEMLSFPFEFLVTNYNEGESPYEYKDKQFLIKDYDISYIPSAGTYIEQEKNNLKNNEKVLIVGDPKINTLSKGFADRRGLLEESPGIPRNLALLPLKYSEDEVSQIGNIINVDKILLSNNATETNFKENAPLTSIIHLSTHSFLFNKQPVIFFSNAYDADNDGFLEASEVVQLKLNSDLVVLSSCNSGLGRIDESEGIIGMSKAFFEAGAKSVVVSLWEVNDKYTSGFMTLFYQNLKDGMDKSEALRNAKIEFIKKYSANPYFWGAFVLNGNTNKVPLKASINTTPYITVLFLVILFAGLIILLVTRRKDQGT